MFGMIILTTIDIRNSVLILKDNLYGDCQPLEDFIISQILVPNESAIKFKLAEYNNEHHPKKITWIPTKSKSSRSANLSWKSTLSWTYEYPLREINAVDFGYFKITGSLFHDQNLIYKILLRTGLLLLFCSLVIIILYPLSKSIPNQMFIEPINNLLKLLVEMKSDNVDQRAVIRPLETSELNEIRDKILSLLTIAEMHSREIALGELAIQVAHDIRSPIAAFDILINDKNPLSDEKKVILRNAAKRINDIANNLLSQYKPEVGKDSQLRKPVLIVDIVNSILSEMHVIFVEHAVNVTLEIDDNSYSAFAEISSIELKRIFANILNNSIDSINNNGEILVTVNSITGSINIMIKDNGCGLPSNLVRKVGKKGFTFGKPNGSGIGLYHAMNYLKCCNGNLVLSSTPDEGTSVNLTLPLSKPPLWFATDISITCGPNTIIILDDEAFIHQIWHERFRTLEEQHTFVFTIENHYKSHEFLKQHQTKCKNSDTVYLIDYFLLGEELNGLELIIKMGIQAQAYLVTSSYDEPSIIAKAEAFGVKIIPKCYAIKVPIVQVETRSQFLFNSITNTLIA